MQALDSQLTVNPYLLVKLEREGGLITAVTVRAPVKGESMRVTKITRAEDPQVFNALLIHSQTDTIEADNFTGKERARLAELGVLLAAEQVSAPVWFSCDLTAPVVELVPARSCRSVRRHVEVTDLIVSPTLRHLGTEGPTTAMRGRLKFANIFHPDRSWVTIDDPITGTVCLYSYAQDIADEMNALCAGRPVPKTVAPQLRERLFEAGIIECAAEAARQRDLCRRERLKTRKELDQRRYVILSHILAPLQIAAIRRYYRTLIAEGFLPFGDEEWPNRFFSGRDPIAHFYQQQLTGLISEIAGQPVKTSFSFFASYHPGSTLPAHRDREQCEWALSLPIDLSPETETLPWPLYLQPPGADHATPIFTGIGDGTLYYGREVRHHRHELTSANYCSFLFLFYVPENFEGSLD
jgi:hypothetical protein